MPLELRIALGIALVAFGLWCLWWVQRRWTSHLPTSKFVLPMVGACLAIGLATRLLSFDLSVGALAGPAMGVLAVRWWHRTGA